MFQSSGLRGGVWWDCQVGGKGRGGRAASGPTARGRPRVWGCWGALSSALLLDPARGVLAIHRFLSKAGHLNLHRFPSHRSPGQISLSIYTFLLWGTPRAVHCTNYLHTSTGWHISLFPRLSWQNKLWVLVYRDWLNSFSQVACISVWRCLGEQKNNLADLFMYVPYTKTQHLIWCQRNIEKNVMCHPVPVLLSDLIPMSDLFILKYIYRAPLIDKPKVAWMLQASWGRSGKQDQEQNSPNLGPAY